MSAEPLAGTLAMRPSGMQRALAWCATRRWVLAVWTATVGWSLALITIVRSHYDDFEIRRFDLGNMTQAVWSTAHGHPLEVTSATGEQVLRLGSHVDPILVVLTPLWLLAPSPLTLAAAQIVAVSLGALPVFWLGRRHLASDAAAALMALAYLAYPWLAWTALDAFHPVAVAIPLFLFCLWFLDAEKTWPYAVCATLVLATGEIMGLALAGVGIWCWLARGQRRIGIATAVAGVAWTAFAVDVVLAHFGHGQGLFSSYYASVGGSPGGITRTAFSDPGAIWSALVGTRDVVYLAALAVPLAGFFVLAPGLAAVSVPQLAANGLSSIFAANDPRAHYVAGVIPFLVVASVFGVARLPQGRRTRAATAVLLLSAVVSLLAGPWPHGPGTWPRWFIGKPSATHVASLHAAVALVPPHAPVSASNSVGAHLAARRYAYSVPVVGRARWIVLDTADSWIPRPQVSETRTLWGRNDPGLLRRFWARVARDPRWSLVFEQDGVLVFRKTSA
jgi:uncharacterized membrane protein